MTAVFNHALEQALEQALKSSRLFVVKGIDFHVAMCTSTAGDLFMTQCMMRTVYPSLHREYIVHHA